MKITVYGPGCKKCHEAEALVRKAVAGRVPKPEEIKGWLGK